MIYFILKKIWNIMSGNLNSNKFIKKISNTNNNLCVFNNKMDKLDLLIYNNSKIDLMLTAIIKDNNNKIIDCFKIDLNEFLLKSNSYIKINIYRLNKIINNGEYKIIFIRNNCIFNIFKFIYKN